MLSQKTPLGDPLAAHLAAVDLVEVNVGVVLEQRGRQVEEDATEDAGNLDVDVLAVDVFDVLCELAGELESLRTTLA